MLLSAAFVIIVRLLGPLRIQWDLSIQLESAYRLTQGYGLTNAFSSQFDLNQPPVSEYLTHFPPGLSLLVAAVLATGVPLAIALKIIYATTTVIGWIAWAAVSSRCLIGPIKLGSLAIPLNLAIAACLPFFYTPSWTIQGTDTFLWAGVPIVILLLCRIRTPSADAKPADFSPAGLGQDVLFAGLAGLTIGLLVLARYPSMFLLPSALLIVLCLDFSRAAILVKRLVAGAVSASIIIAPIAVYIRWASQINASTAVSSNNILQTHRGLAYRSTVTDPTMLETISTSLGNLLASFSGLYRLTGLNISPLEDFFDFMPILGDILGIAFFSGIVALLAYLFYLKNYRSLTRVDIPIALLCLVTSFVLFGIVLSIVVVYSPLTISRYYVPVIYCLVLVAYKIAALVDINSIVRRLAIGLVIVFVLFNVVLKPLDRLFFDSEKGLMFAVLAMETTLDDIPYPSNQLLSFHEESRSAIAAIEAEEPNALFFVQSYPLYLSYVTFEDPLKLRRIADEAFWESAYLSEPTKIFWVTNLEDCWLICPSQGNFNSDYYGDEIEILKTLSNLETVFTSTQSGTVIRVSDLPAGYQFSNGTGNISKPDP